MAESVTSHNYRSGAANPGCSRLQPAVYKDENSHHAQTLASTRRLSPVGYVHIAAGNFLLLDIAGVKAPDDLYGSLPKNANRAGAIDVLVVVGENPERSR
ncbi:MAG: hypothetical protein LAP38_15175 [Acidobacteriia bacterium]|nr:hypothetical protein [Terriglobia bacterium]